MFSRPSMSTVTEVGTKVRNRLIDNPQCQAFAIGKIEREVPIYQRPIKPYWTNSKCLSLLISAFSDNFILPREEISDDCSIIREEYFPGNGSSISSLSTTLFSPNKLCNRLWSSYDEPLDPSIVPPHHHLTFWKDIIKFHRDATIQAQCPVCRENELTCNLAYFFDTEECNGCGHSMCVNCLFYMGSTVCGVINQTRNDTAVYDFSSHNYRIVIPKKMNCPLCNAIVKWIMIPSLDSDDVKNVDVNILQYYAGPMSLKKFINFYENRMEFANSTDRLFLEAVTSIMFVIEFLANHNVISAVCAKTNAWVFNTNVSPVCLFLKWEATYKALEAAMNTILYNEFSINDVTQRERVLSFFTMMKNRGQFAGIVLRPIFVTQLFSPSLHNQHSTTKKNDEDNEDEVKFVACYKNKLTK